uniref:Uncharacterized protein n=1 Tax=Gasterosteus aculeatus TaxID=69293 RepID=G3NHT1_GASAC
ELGEGRGQQRCTHREGDGVLEGSTDLLHRTHHIPAVPWEIVKPHQSPCTPLLAFSTLKRVPIDFCAPSGSSSTSGCQEPSSRSSGAEVTLLDLHRASADGASCEGHGLSGSADLHMWLCSSSSWSHSVSLLGPDA